MSCDFHADARGFSLIELLITLAIAAILLAIAAPSMREFAARQALVSASNSLVTGLQLARSTAVKNGQPALLCPSLHAGSCGAAEDWSHGWLVRTERPPHSTAEAMQGYLPANIQVSLSQGRRHVRFLPDGRSPGTNLTLHLCSRGVASRQIVVSNSGRVRSTLINNTPC